MYKKSFLSLMVMLLFVATSCSSEEPAAIEPGGTISGDAGKTLIVYFSWGGNTRTVANHIHDLIGGDIVEVETVVPYPDTYEEVTQIAPGELESDYRPELKTKVENMDEYDTLIVGTPIWGGHLTPAMKSFLKNHDLRGKIIYPFVTNEGWAGHALQDFAASLSGGCVKSGMNVKFSGDILITKEVQIRNWAKEAMKDIF